MSYLTRRRTISSVVYSVCIGKFNKVVATQIALAGGTTNNVNEPLDIQEFIDKQSNDEF